MIQIVLSVQSDSKSSEKETEEQEGASVAGQDISDKIEFSLLHSLFSLDLSENLYNWLLNEVVKYKCCKSIKYTRGNNTEGIIIAVPSFQNLSGYNKEFRKKESVIDDVVQVIARS